MHLSWVKHPLSALTGSLIFINATAIIVGILKQRPLMLNLCTHSLNTLPSFLRIPQSHWHKAAEADLWVFHTPRLTELKFNVPFDTKLIISVNHYPANLLASTDQKTKWKSTRSSHQKYNKPSLMQRHKLYQHKQWAVSNIESNNNIK